MLGDDRERYCAVCDRSVLNLSALSEAEIAELRGPMCVRLEKPRRRLPLVAAAAALSVAIVTGEARADLPPPEDAPKQQAANRKRQKPPRKKAREKPKYDPADEPMGMVMKF